MKIKNKTTYNINSDNHISNIFAITDMSDTELQVYDKIGAVNNVAEIERAAVDKIL